MLSVSSMLNCGGLQQQHHHHQQQQQQQQQQQPRQRPSVLDISTLLCPLDSPPSLSPSLTPSPSPASVTSSCFAGYSFSSIPKEEEHQPMIWHHDLPLKKQQVRRSLPQIESRSPSPPVSEEEEEEEEDDEEQTAEGEDEEEEAGPPLKAKRRRANAKQLEVLNQVFDRTFFPSTQMRAELGRKLGMSPRTVQIWFQNKRQAMRTRERQRLLKLHD
ncbi:hypothetical protein DFQ28_010782 [Apophysomyces sp. BC1034]|nr:hypothetical protein DFQ30_010899 [Apophysomyces sp. BC1015]KAG0181355.1 hypothetical protein DFQ29_008625 [Apophysomyces sp. BC1021]KAG0191843.1 hypothetical protein DFQ28_010782 [Apophysomyces sp. BC1034]